MKLYELSRNTEFKIKGLWEVYVLHRIDGSYSYCTATDGTVYHFSVNTEVEKV